MNFLSLHMRKILYLLAFLFVLLFSFFLTNLNMEADEKNAQGLSSSTMSTSEGIIIDKSEHESDFLPFEDLMLKPDLEPLPPSDIKIIRKNKRIELLFTAKFWNKGTGPFEFINTENNKKNKDEEFEVNQRIYLENKKNIDLHIGTMFWHNIHDHYHLEGVALYILEPANTPNTSTINNKTSFCLRDMELNRDFASSSRRTYTTCKTLKQGLSVGWVDIYDQTIPGQSIDITNLPPGDYILKIIIDPENIFVEESKENNTTSTLFTIDEAKRRIKILN